jgi:hypothetical protein
VLVDLSANYPEEAKIYKFPVACTSAVWDIIDKACKNKRAHNDYKGVVWDVLYMSTAFVRSRPDPSTVLFQVKIIGAGRKSLFTFKAMVGPGDDAEPVVTIMLPEED